MIGKSVRLRGAAVCLFTLPLCTAAVVDGISIPAFAQAPAAAPAGSARQIGSVKSIDGSTVMITTDAGQQVTATVAPNARVLQLAPGSTDLKTAQPGTLADVTVGDRVLVTGVAGESATAITASRLILMKSGDIAQRHEAEQADWQRRGTGGIVTAVDPASHSISVSAGARKLQVTTAANTRFRRYADGSVKFEDAKPGEFGQLQVGDQLRVRGAKSADGGTIEAEEIVSGSFKNLSGTLLTIDAAGNTVSFKDLATKRNVTVQLTPSSALHKLSPQAATMLAARAKGEAGAAGPGGGAASGRPQGAGDRPQGSGDRPQGAGPGSQGAGGERPQGGAERSPASGGAPGGGRGGDLAQMIARMPTETLSDLKVGDAVMVVAEQSSSGNTLTAVTLLSGVEPILAAAPNGSTMTLSPWSVGTGAPDGGGGSQ